jgi:hypothetical protein
MQNFTVADTLGTIKACVALAPLMFAPGYVIGWVFDLLEFRQRRRILRFILAVPLSIAICPMLSYLLARFLPPALSVLCIIVFLACSLLLAKEVQKGNLRPFSRHLRIALGLIGVWTVVAIASLVDLQLGDRLYPPITAYDHSTRVCMMAAIARHVPPNNPFAAHPSVPLRYHYLWMLFCSLPLRFAHLHPRHLMYGGIVWCGVGLICSIALGLKFLLRVAAGIQQQTLLGTVLLCVTGLDIVPTVYLGAARGVWFGDMEAWNEPQITSWFGSLLWAPHHVAGLVACFVGLLIVVHQACSVRRWSPAPIIVAGMAFASGAGMSVYVTFTFAVAIALYLLSLISRKDWLAITMFVGAGVVAALWALPFLLSLRGAAAGGAVAEFGLRPFPLGIALTEHMGIPLRTQFAWNLANAIFLPVNYALELGFFLVVCGLRLWRLVRGRVEATAHEMGAWALVAASFLIGTFMRSTAISSNDLGWRCFLPAQLISVLWSAELLGDWWSRVAAPESTPRPWVRASLVSLMILGAIGTAYEVTMLRTYPILYDRRDIAGKTWLEPDGQFGKRTYAIRSVYESLDPQLAASAVLQNNPTTGDPIPHMLYSGHDFAAGGLDCGVAFGADPLVCRDRVRRLAEMFEAQTVDLEGTCRDYGIDVIIAQDTDPVWRDPSSWIWRKHPVVSNHHIRAFSCTTPAR